MSIISEALKKAQIVPGSARRKFIVKKPAIFLLFFLMLALSFFLYRSLAEKKPVELVSEPVETPVAVEEKEPPFFSQAQSLELSPDQVTDVIHLTGIMYTPKKPLAVVNGGVWSEGEYIGKFKIQEIGQDFLKISSNGRESVIKLRR